MATVLEEAPDAYQRHHPQITVRWTCPGCKRKIVSKYHWNGQPHDGDEASLFCEACEMTHRMQYDQATGLWTEIE